MFEAADGLGVMTLLPPGSAAREEELAAAAAPAIAALRPDGGARYERFWGWIVVDAPATSRTGSWTSSRWSRRRRGAASAGR